MRLHGVLAAPTSTRATARRIRSGADIDPGSLQSPGHASASSMRSSMRPWCPCQSAGHARVIASRTSTRRRAVDRAVRGIVTSPGARGVQSRLTGVRRPRPPRRVARGYPGRARSRTAAGEQLQRADSRGSSPRRSSADRSARSLVAHPYLFGEVGRDPLAIAISSTLRRAARPPERSDGIARLRCIRPAAVSSRSTVLARRGARPRGRVGTMLVLVLVVSTISRRTRASCQVSRPVCCSTPWVPVIVGSVALPAPWRVVRGRVSPDPFALVRNTECGTAFRRAAVLASIGPARRTR